jgi:hypothetical protein
MRQPRDPVIRAATVCLAWFVAVVVAEHALRSDLSPGEHRISEYAVGSGGWLMTTGFLAWALAFALTAVALQRLPLRSSPVGRALTALLALCAIGALGTALFETGTSAGMVPPGARLTAANHVHDVASAVLQASLVAAILCALTLDDWSRLRSTTIALLVAALAISLLFSGAGFGLPGVRQRVLVAIGCAWHFLLLRALTAGAPARAA